MSPPGRPLLPEEAQLWALVARTVRPIEKSRPSIAAAVLAPAATDPARAAPPPPGKQPRRIVAPPPQVVLPLPSPPPRLLAGHTLDANWDRRLARGLARPDFTIDLHGASLDGAYVRLNHGLSLAAGQGARLVLLITGRPQAHIDPADRASRRGAIRAKYLDWLAQGGHAAKIASIRPAHPRHGGAGAVYIVLRKAGSTRGDG